MALPTVDRHAHKCLAGVEVKGTAHLQLERERVGLGGWYLELGLQRRRARNQERVLRFAALRRAEVGVAEGLHRHDPCDGRHGDRHDRG